MRRAGFAHLKVVFFSVRPDSFKKKPWLDAAAILREAFLADAMAELLPLRKYNLKEEPF